MKIVFVTTTSKLPSWLDEVVKDYSKKISFWFPTELKNLQTKSVGRDASHEKIKAEAEKLRGFIEPSDFVVLCDEKGRQFSSMQFAQKIETVMAGGKKRLVFIIGGAYGVSEEVKKNAQLICTLSPMTFNHHVAIAVILEQVYRALTIIKGIKYHNE